MVASCFFKTHHLLVIEIQYQTCKKIFVNVPLKLPKTQFFGFAHIPTEKDIHPTGKRFLPLLNFDLFRSFLNTSKRLPIVPAVLQVQFQTYRYLIIHV